MSMENVKKFYELAMKDEGLKSELRKINETITVTQSDFVGIRKLVEEEIVPLAKKRGIDFTADELVSFANEKYTELSEEDLLEVNGGLSPKNTAIGLSTVLLLSLGATSAINLLAPNNDLNQSVSISAPADTQENEKTDEENDNDSQDEMNTKESNEQTNAEENSAQVQQNAQEENSTQVQQNAQAENSNGNVNSNANAEEAQAGTTIESEEVTAQGEEAQAGTTIESEEVTAQGEEGSLLGGMQDLLDQGRFDYERESYKGRSWLGKVMTSRATLVKELAEFLRSIDGDLENVQESDQDKLKSDVAEVFNWIFSASDGLSSGVIKYHGHGQSTAPIANEDREIIEKFANDYDLVDNDEEGWITMQEVAEDDAEAQEATSGPVKYKALSSLSSRTTMLKDLANYIRSINGDLERVPEEARDALKKDVTFVAGKLSIDDETGKIYIQDIIGINHEVAESDAQQIRDFYVRHHFNATPEDTALEAAAEATQQHYIAQDLDASLAEAVKNIADYLRSINSDLTRVPEGDRDALRTDVIFVDRHIAGPDLSGEYLLFTRSGKQFVESSDAKQIRDFYNNNNYYQQFMQAVQAIIASHQIPYEAQSSLSSRATMVENVGNYLRYILEDIRLVRDGDREALMKDAEFLAKHLVRTDDGGYKIKQMGGLQARVETADAETILRFVDQVTPPEAQEDANPAVAEPAEVIQAAGEQAATNQAVESNQKAYKAQSSFSSRPTMVKNVANYLRSINGEIKNVPDGDVAKLIDDVKFLANLLFYAGDDGYEIKQVMGSAKIETADAEEILNFYRDNIQPQNQGAPQAQENNGQAVAEPATEEAENEDGSFFQK